MVYKRNIGGFQQLFGSRNFIIVDNNNADEDVFAKSIQTYSWSSRKQTYKTTGETVDCKRTQEKDRR